MTTPPLTDAAYTESRFQAVFEQAPLSMQLLAADGRTLAVNRAWEALWLPEGDTRFKQLILSPAYNSLHDAQLHEKGVVPLLLRAFAGEAVRIPPIEYDPAPHPGNKRWVGAYAHPIRTEEGRVCEVMLIHEDVTDSIAAERDLRLSEERFRSLVTATSQIVWTAAADGTAVEDSATWRAYTGQAFHEWLDAVHPDDRERAAQAWHDALAERSVYNTEYRLRSVDGGYRWTAVRAVPLLDADGSIREWMGANTDIHAMKEIEAELERRLAAERRHAALLAQVASASRELHAALSAQAIAQVLVGQVRALIGAHLAVVTLADDGDRAQGVDAMSASDDYLRRHGAAPAEAGPHAEVARHNRPMRLTQAELADHAAWRGGPAPRGWLAVPLAGQDGRNLGVIQAADREGGFDAQDEAILVQLAAIAATGFENARLVAALREQDRRKDEFLAMLAHELRNPLAPVSAAAELMAAVDLDRDRLRQTSQVIGRQVRHMTALVDDLLDVSRVTRGLVVLERAPQDLKQIVAAAVEQVRPLVEAKRHRLATDLAPEAAHVLGDQKRLVQILTNLLNNAAKYTPPGGSIRVATEVDAGRVRLHVRDDGIGMEPQLQPHVFDLFAQAERTSDRSQGGLGIGLALVRSLVELHDGVVACASEGLGRGSVFTVTLPRLPVGDAGAAGAGRRHALPHAARRRRILVVDDNADAAEMLALYLEAGGHETLVEHCPLRALERARASAPDVCVLDIGLPGMDGNELARRLRREDATADALLIAVTGYGQDQDRQTAREAGFDHHLVKPVDAAALLALLA